MNSNFLGLLYETFISKINKKISSAPVVAVQHPLHTKASLIKKVVHTIGDETSLLRVGVSVYVLKLWNTTIPAGLPCEFFIGRYLH